MNSSISTSIPSPDYARGEQQAESHPPRVGARERVGARAAEDRARAAGDRPPAEDRPPQTEGSLPLAVVRRVDELRAALEPAKSSHRAVGLVATMGALHEGHLSLIRRAREECDVVVVSLFVNPAQFNDDADLERYPRDERRDRALAQLAGADLLFAPPAREVYPKGFATSVEVLGLTDRLEGVVRGSAHFKGVTTVVAKLLNMVAPDVAYFGQKDAQQVVVIKRLVEDLDMAVRIEACPTVREPDGLAMSSRNAHLSATERIRARALSSALAAACAAVTAGERSAEALTATARDTMGNLAVEPEYVELVHPDTLEPLSELDEPALLAIAARVGSIRLIDNVTLYPTAQIDRCGVDPNRPAVHPNRPAVPSEYPNRSTLSSERPNRSAVPFERPNGSTLPSERPNRSTLPSERPNGSTLPSEPATPRETQAICSV